MTEGSQNDRNRELRWQTLNRYAMLTVVTAISILSVAAALAAKEEHPLLAFALLFFGWTPVVLVHELGHAIAAWLCGWRVWAFAVAPFVLRTRPALLNVGFQAYGGDVGGFVVPAPRRPQALTRLRRVVISAGGPVASLLFAIALIAVAIGAPPGTISDSVRPLALGLGGLSLAAALGSAWPVWSMRSGGNDGLHILQHLGGPAPDQHEAARQFSLLLWDFGVPQRDWEPWMRQAMAETADQASYFHSVMEAIEADDAVKARAGLTQWTRNGSVHDAVRLVDAYVTACMEGDAAAAERILASTRDLHNVRPEIMLLRQLVFVQLSLAEGDSAAARERVATLSRAIYGVGGLPGDFQATVIARMRKKLPAP